MHGAHRAFRPETVATLLLAVALGVAIGRTAYDYFVIYARSPSLRGAFASDLTAVGQTLAASPVWRADPSNVYLPRSYDDNRGSIAYFLYPWLSPAQRPDWIDERSVGSFVDFAKTVPLPSEPSLYVVPADDTTTIPILGPGVQRVTPIFDRGQVTARAVLAEPVSGAAHPPQLARFGSWLDLDSASIDPRVATFGWRVVARPSYQPSIFVYVQDAQGHTIAQADEEIAYPIDAWKPGQQIVTRHQLHLPPGTPPGAYRVVVGVYDKASGKRETPTRGGQPAIDVGVGTLTLAGATPGVPAAGRAINQSLAPGLSLLGDDLPGGEVEAGTSVPITLVWQATGVSRPDDEIDIDLRSASGTTLTEWRGQPGGPAFPTAAWAPSQAIREIQDVRIPPTASGAVVVEVAARAVGASSLGPSVSLGQIAVKASSHVFAAPTPKEPLQAPFSGVGALLGADVPSNPVAPGGAVQVTLYWRASGATPGGYTVFVHVLDDQNQVVGQRDEPPVHGTRPTTGWIEGEYIVDPHQLTVDPRARSGVYTVEVGMYDPASGVRVATGTVDNRIVIGSVRVGPASVPGG